MKNYLIKNSDIMHEGKIFPEGSTIDLEDKEAETLSDYLIESKPEPLVLNSIQDQHKLELKKRSK